MTKLRSQKEMFLKEDNKIYYLSPKGTRYLVEGNNKYRGSKKTDPIIERTDYPNPPSLKEFGFNSLEEFKSWLAEESSKITSHSKEECKSYFSKKSSMLENLAQKWMKSRDTTIYSDKDYLFETIHCSLFVTGEFKKSGILGKNSGIDNLLRTFHHLGLFDKKITIVDLGAGLGLTTLFMAKVMPKAKIYYLDASSASAKILKKLIAKAGINNIVFADDIEECPSVIDVVVAFEFIEHIEDKDVKGTGAPLVGIEDWLTRIPSEGHFLYSTMWNAEQNNGSTIGHFTKYNFDGNIVQLPSGKSDKRSREPHKMFVRSMTNRGFRIRNGGGAKTEWDWKGHVPYCFTK